MGVYTSGVYTSGFSGIYTRFDSFLPDTYKIGMIYTLIIFALKTLFPKVLYQVWFISSRVDCAMNPITENSLDILL